MKYQRPVAPVQAPSHSSSLDEGSSGAVPVDPAFVAQHEKWVVAAAACDEAKKMRGWKYSMDGISLAMVIAAICGSQISIQVGQMFERTPKIQPWVPWKFLKKTTRAVLLPARERLLTEMQTMRQRADESLEIYIAPVQRLEADLSMVSDNSDMLIHVHVM